MWAVVEIGKKQYLVEKGMSIQVEKLKVEEGQKEVVFDRVLLLTDGKKNIKIGTPYVEEAKVTAKFEGEKKGKKVIVYKYKRRKKYRKKQGHRQNYTLLKISKITAS
ncbi:MAG: 50S ribosomal protein L21 [Candidatus Omnitrophota bacterium]